jgi:hypothetical protein
MKPITIRRKKCLHLVAKEAGHKIAATFSIVKSCRKTRRAHPPVLG